MFEDINGKGGISKVIG